MHKNLTNFVWLLSLSTAVATAKTNPVPKSQTKPNVKCESLLSFLVIDRAWLKSDTIRLQSLEYLVRALRETPVFIPAEVVRKFRTLTLTHGEFNNDQKAQLEELVLHVFDHSENEGLFFKSNGKLHSLDHQFKKYVIGSDEIHFQQRLGIFLTATAGLNGLINHNPIWRNSLKMISLFDNYHLDRQNFARLSELRKSPYRRMQEDELRQLRTETLNRVQTLYDQKLSQAQIPVEIIDLIDQMVLETGTKKPFYFFRESVLRVEQHLNSNSRVSWHLTNLWNGQGDVILDGAISREQAKEELLAVVLKNNKATILGDRAMKEALTLESQLRDLDLVLSLLR